MIILDNWNGVIVFAVTPFFLDSGKTIPIDFAVDVKGIDISHATYIVQNGK